MEENSKYKEVLQREGVKSTKHRYAILELLEHSEYPLTVDEIFLSLKEKTDSINLSTVYRTLETFTSKNIVIKTNRVDDGKSRYELNHHQHKHHLFCVSCHKMIAIEECPIGELQQIIKSKIDFDVTGHNLEIYGYCHNCKEIKTSE